MILGIQEIKSITSLDADYIISVPQNNSLGICSIILFFLVTGSEELRMINNVLGFRLMPLYFQLNFHSIPTNNQE
jgi:hypothetical protein